jgi:hypothetical protein
MYNDLLREFRESVENQKIEDFMIESVIDPIRSHLNLYFYSTKHIDRKTQIYGSFYRGTAIVEFGVIDILYILPDNLRSHISLRQSDAYTWTAHLLRQIFSGTQWSIEFDEISNSFLISGTSSWPIRLKPVFFLNDDRFATLELLSASSTQVFKPFVAEGHFRAMNFNSNRNLEVLAKAVRYWVHANNVPLGGFLIDCLAMSFMKTSPYRRFSSRYQDCLLREFFFYLSNIDRHQKSWIIEGTTERVYRTGVFEPAAEKAYHLAERMIANSIIRHDTEAQAALRTIVGNSIALPP